MNPNPNPSPNPNPNPNPNPTPNPNPNPNEASLRLPTLVAALGGVHVTGMAAGAHHTLALSDAGHLYSWGLGGNGRLGHGDTEPRLLPTPIAALVQRGVVVTCLAAGDLVSPNPDPDPDH